MVIMEIHLKENNDIWQDLDDRQEMVLSKYRMKGETNDDFVRRVTFGNKALYELFKDKKAIWGGRNLYAIGREGNITGSNCYVATDPEDSLEDIYRADYEIARTYSFGGGQGMNLSKIRPRNAKVNNTSNTSPGVMVFAEKYSHTTLNTQQHQRRGALMLVLNIDHPDIIDFATAKLDLSKINGANISIAMTDDFMNAVKRDEDWTMKFTTPHETITKTVRAKDLMELIAYANHTMGDPGMLFIDNVNNYHLLSEYENVKFTATNPCGEQPLLPNGSCNLGSINLNAFVEDSFTEHARFNYEDFRHAVKEMIWGLDELLDMLGDRHALPAQRVHVQRWREVGLGVMGLADLALSLNMSYGSDAFIRQTESIMEEMANAAAQASALRAKEKGAFPLFDFDLVSKSKFFKDVYRQETQDLIKEYGLRNSRLLSIAPTGSISNVLGVSGGVEPFFMLGYNRVIQSVFEGERTVTVWEKTPKELAKRLNVETLEELPVWASITSQNISFDKRARVQATIQNFVDTAISSTFNLPNKATTKDIIDIYFKAWELGLKGATVFRDNCAKVGILSGMDGWQADENPATPPKLEVKEIWQGEHTKEFITKIEVQTSGSVKTEEQALTDICPECGSPLVKRAGCTQCSNNECYFEKCSI